MSIYISTDKNGSFPVKIYNNNKLISTVTVSKSSPIEFPVPTISMIEASTSLRVMKPVTMGIHLSGEKSFFASLRFAGCRSSCKTEIIASKGKTALGKEFFVAMDQIILYGNNPAGMLYQTSIMATQDNTKIKVSDYNSNLVFINGDNSDELNFTLNKDESYIVVARKQDNPNSPNILDDWDPNLIGAKITSDKPIIVNNGNFISQDLGESGGGGVNLDQSIPTDKLGKEFFLVNGMTKTETAMEKAIVVATKNNTQIFFNDEIQPFVTLNAGEHFMGPFGKQRYLDGNQPSFKNPQNIIIPTRGIYIKSSEPVYVFQLIGGFNFLIQGPSPDFTQITSAMTLSYPLDKNYFPKPLQYLDNIIKIPSVDKIGSFNGKSKLSIKTQINANVKVNGSLLTNPSPIVGKDGWGYYTIVPVSGDIEIQSDMDLNVDLVGGFEYTGYASSYTGFSNDPYILVNGNCIQESVYLKLNNQDFISFQWQLNGIDIPGANSYEYQPLVEGSYQCVVTYTGFSFTTASVFIPNCPYNVYDINIGSSCHNFEIDAKFTQTGHVFSKLEILTQPNNGTANISNRKVIVKMNDTFAGVDRLVYKITATDGYYEVYKANFNILPNPIADVKSELQPKSYLDETYYFDLYNAINNENNEIFQFFPSLTDAEKNENEIKESLSNYSSTLSEVFIKVTNQDNCYVIKKIVLVKPPIIPDSVTLPNAFSPNNDGVNDTWDYSLLNALQDIELKIYDRYGKLVYTHIKDFFWNGKVNNKVLQSGSYWVVYSYSSKGVRVSNKSMWILLKNR
ncbi:gliding motility-associated-like protein [Epilithonimonas hungarica]|uniref:T9SS type B sorting domain-containing protein n=1 Tax=Epilithonimonas hungarica TaxID=454006 RepID=UPI0027822EA5|nr:T9SS type B sorting domain-containing protein [Epilithonimonas hungarica]MDP9956519.1 gliding motility-associated-like protein [Epilithonimonas hungarica]